MTKRKHRRFSITGTASLHFEDEGKIKTIRAVLGSISSLGIGLYADNHIEANKQVTVTINFISIGGGIEDSVIEGSVVYSRDLGKIHFVGIQFNEAVNSENKPLLYKHIHNIHSFDE
jgi:hypothetical protein